MQDPEFKTALGGSVVEPDHDAVLSVLGRGRDAERKDHRHQLVFAGFSPGWPVSLKPRHHATNLQLSTEDQHFELVRRLEILRSEVDQYGQIGGQLGRQSRSPQASYPTAQDVEEAFSDRRRVAKKSSGNIHRSGPGSQTGTTTRGETATGSPLSWDRPAPSSSSSDGSPDAKT